MRNSHGNRTGLYPYKNEVGHQTQHAASLLPPTNPQPSPLLQTHRRKPPIVQDGRVREGQNVSSAMSVLLLGSHVGHQVNNSVAVAELIVVPGEKRTIVTIRTFEETN